MGVTTTSPKEAISLGNARARRTLQAVQAYRRMRNKDIAEKTGMPVNTVQSYTGGSANITAGIMDLFADALSVEPFVLAMNERDAMQWVLDHAPNPEPDPVTMLETVLLQVA